MSNDVRARRRPAPLSPRERRRKTLRMSMWCGLAGAFFSLAGGNSEGGEAIVWILCALGLYCAGFYALGTAREIERSQL